MVVLGKDSLLGFPGIPGAPCSAVGGLWAAVDWCVQDSSEVLCVTDIAQVTAEAANAIKSIQATASR